MAVRNPLILVADGKPAGREGAPLRETRRKVKVFGALAER